MSRRIVLTAVAVLATAALPACSASTDGSDGRVTVVASTNVYGDIAAQVGGGAVQVTSIITDPAQDPHSYEASARTQLALSKADIVIENGGGYDDFVDSLLDSLDTSATVIDAVRVSGKTAPDGGELNEHVWYDFGSVQRLTQKLARTLETADPADAGTFRTNADRFTAKLTALQSTEASVRAAHAGDGVAITEPVPLYLLEACGLVDRTPAEFSQAIEGGSDVSVRVLDRTLDLFRHHDVDALVYNEQTAGTETDRVRAAAEDNDVPVVPVTETLPEGTDYIAWMTANLAAIEHALA